MKTILAILILTAGAAHAGEQEVLDRLYSNCERVFPGESDAIIKTCVSAELREADKVYDLIEAQEAEHGEMTRGARYCLDQILEGWSYAMVRTCIIKEQGLDEKEKTLTGEALLEFKVERMETYAGID